MEEERIWTEINQIKNDVQGIRTDVTDIRDALLGDQYGNKGYAKRILDLEDHCNIVRTEIDTQKAFRRTVKWVTGIAVAIISFLFTLFKFIIGQG